MMNWRTYTIVFVAMLVTNNLCAQQIPFSTQYLINPYALSPTMAGYTGHPEVFINYRTDWTKIDGSPKTFRANGHGNVYKDKLWLGGELITDKAGVLSVFNANLSLTYKLQVENDQFLYFGIWTSFFQASANIADGIGIDPNDPLIQNNGKLNSSAFNMGFGINYNWQRFNLGLSMPTSLGNSNEYELNSQFKYRVQRAFQIHASYLFDLNELWQLQTIGLYRKTVKQPATFELSLMSIYQGRFWGGLLYRNSGVLAINLGGHVYNGFVLNYSYEVGLSNINNGSGGSHEITLGYRFKFKEKDYFNLERKGTSGRRGRRSSGTSSYPEVQDYNYKRIR